MNFCFWPDNAAGVFEYENMTRNLEKILKSDPDFFTCSRLAQVTTNFLRQHVFTTEKEFSLLESRAKIVNEVGVQIQTHFGGSFEEFVRRSNYDAPTFVNLVAMYLTGFRDQAIYNGSQVMFYKRAQILCADLIGAYSDIGAPRNIDNGQQLTMFADYRVPQILRHRGILTYSPALAELVDSESELAYSSREEVEIRAYTLIAVEQIMEKIAQSPELGGKIKSSYEVDWLLW